VLVQFGSGETFDGPWTDDPSVADSEVAFRRINRDWVSSSSAPPRVNSGAFQPHPQSASISVTLAGAASEAGFEPEALALSNFPPQYGLASFAVKDARDIGFWIRRVPLAGDPAHAMLFVRHPDTGHCPDAKECRKLGRKLVEYSSIVSMPP
jgi:hypothetical protein